MGKFELNVDADQIRFHAAQILQDAAIDEDVIDRLIYTTMGVLDQYVLALLSVIYGNEEPKAAVAFAEAGSCQAEQTAEGDESGDE